MQYPIIYKTIPTQYAFYVHKDGTVQITQVTAVPKERKFSSEEEAREFISKYNEQL